MSDLNVEIFLFLQNFVGHSLLFDSLVSLAVSNPLVKAGVIGFCFVAAWFSKEENGAFASRKTLVFAVFASVMAILIGRQVSETTASLRPAIQGDGIYVLQQDRFERVEPLAIQRPLDSEGRDRIQSFALGQFDEGDCQSFPSDHAALYISLSIGVLLVHRGFGSLALVWAIIVVLLPRVMTGMHWPVDILAGAGIGCATTLTATWVARRNLGWLDRMLAASLRMRSLSSGIMFLVVFEACNSFYNLRIVLGLCVRLLRLWLSS